MWLLIGIWKKEVKDKYYNLDNYIEIIDLHLSNLNSMNFIIKK